MNCDIKDSAKAWNDGVDAFEKAFKFTGGKTTEAIKYAIDEINRQNPGFEFDVSSFTNPLIASLKENNLVAQNYKFTDGKKPADKVDKIAEKMNGLNASQKKEFARKVFSGLQEDGLLTDEKVKNIYSEAIGVPAMNEKINQQIDITAKALQEDKSVEDEIQEEIKRMQADKETFADKKLSPEKDKEYTKKFEELGTRRQVAKAEAMKQSAKFADMLQEKRFWLHQLTDYMPLNLMNPNSLAKNISGAIADGLVRTIGGTLASPVSQAVAIFTKINSNPIGSRSKGLSRAQLKSKASAAWKYGATDFNNELPRANYLNSANRLKRAMDDTGLNKFKGILSGILKIHPDIISKGLTVPDALVYEMLQASEFNRIADAKGLKGAEKEAFMLDPDEKSREVAENIAKRGTFKQDLPDWLSGVRKLSAYDPGKRSDEIIRKKQEDGKLISPTAVKIGTGLSNLLLKSAVPFIKTPINIMRTASRVLLPEYELGQSLMDAKKETDPVEKQRLIIDGITRATAGMFVRHIAFQMIAQGLISAGYDDEDRKTKDIIEQELGGPNRINYSALVRGLMFKDMKKQAGDKYVDLNILGALGVVMAVYAHAYNKYDKNEIENRTSYNKNLSNAISIPWDLAWAEMSSTMDFTFFTGINQLQGAVMNKEGYETNQLATQYIANAFTGVAPSTYQKLSMQASPDVKKQFDKDLSFSENLANVLGYRFAFQNKQLKNKYFSLTEKGESGKKKKAYMLFDNYLGRVLEAEFDFAKVTDGKINDPISRLHEALKDVPKDERDKLFPPAINQEVNINTGKSKKSQKVNLTEDQYDYLREQASNYRMMLATPFIMSEDFKKADHETKVKVLQSYYQEGLKHAKKDLKARYPNIKKQAPSDQSISSKKVKSIVNKYD